MRRWLNYAKPYWVYFVVGPLCMIVEVLGEILLPKLYANIVDTGIATGNVGYIIAVCALMILAALLMMTGGVGGAYFAAKASVNVAADVRKDLYSKIQKFSFSNIDHFSTGSLVTRLTNDVTQIMNMINMLMRMLSLIHISVHNLLDTVLNLIDFSVQFADQAKGVLKFEGFGGHRGADGFSGSVTDFNRLVMAIALSGGC